MSCQLLLFTLLAFSLPAAAVSLQGVREHAPITRRQKTTHPSAVSLEIDGGGHTRRSKQDLAEGDVRWNNPDAANWCMTVDGGVNQDGTAVRTWPCETNGAPSTDQWKMPASGTGTIKWKAHPDKCLYVEKKDSSSAVNTNGNPLQITTCSDSSDQQWIVPIGGEGKIQLKDHSNFCVDVKDGATTTEGTALQLWECNNELSMQWVVPTVTPSSAATDDGDPAQEPAKVCSASEGYRSPDGVNCISNCPPGWIKQSTVLDGTVSQWCELCKGSARRRHTQAQTSGSTEEGQCTKCPSGFIEKVDADECQNIQDTCDKTKDCLPCASCMQKSESALAQCVEDEPPATCFNPGTTWCGGAMANLVDCQSFSFGCYFRVQCQHPCICSQWKDAFCGGETGNGTCNPASYNLLLRQLGGKKNRTDVSSVPEVMAMTQRAQRTSENAHAVVTAAGHADLDESLAGKCL